MGKCESSRSSISLSLLPLFLAFALCSSSIPRIQCRIDQPSRSTESGLDHGVRTFIVQVSPESKPPFFSTFEDWYTSVLSSIKGHSRLHSPFARLGLKRPAEIGIRYLYRNVFQGFTVTMTSAEARALSKIPGFLSTTLDASLQLQTTRTPEFLGLSPGPGGAVFSPPSDLWHRSRHGDGVIVGLIDSGIWPERASFDDSGMSPVPERWKGECDPSAYSFNGTFCNRKIIGARAFYKGYESVEGRINEDFEFKSPRDSEGHGTHTASTVAGHFVHNASVLGYGNGVAVGMAPNAHLAIYKACWATGCFSSDILAAFDAAIDDGVDIISLSVSGSPSNHYEDPIAIGSFAAMEKGILTSASAGNDGPSLLSVSNTAPWILTVAASTIDRNFQATVTLGNGSSFTGASLFSVPGVEVVNSMTRQLPIVYAADAALPGGNKTDAAFCTKAALDPQLVAGRVVVCDRGRFLNPEHAEVVRQLGGAATIVANTEIYGETLPASTFRSPAAAVGYTAGLVIKEYARSGRGGEPVPTAAIEFEGTATGVKPAPTMASFSSRGPNELVPEILKPDITAPGVNILAAWTGRMGPTSLPNEDRVVDFNIISGTSMSCPHISGVAALLRNVHPHWSASSIKSALMTTSTTLDNTGAPMLDDSFDGTFLSNPFVHGAGHVSPMASMDPGLVYHTSVQDYVDYVCSLNYTSSQLRLFTKGKYKCSSNYNERPGDLNYPSFSIVFYQLPTPSVNPPFHASYRRMLLNVGGANSTYTAEIVPPYGVKVTVEPHVLHFCKAYQTLAYRIHFEADPIPVSGTLEASFGSLTWKDGLHSVQSPIVFLWVNRAM